MSQCLTRRHADIAFLIAHVEFPVDDLCIKWGWCGDPGPGPAAPTLAGAGWWWRWRGAVMAHSDMQLHLALPAVIPHPAHEVLVSFARTHLARSGARIANPYIHTHR